MKKLFYHIKQNGVFYAYATVSVAIILVLFSLLHMSILQSDDYSYAAYFKNGFFEFLKLTREHYLTTNGRVLVHIAAQIALSLPKAVMTLLNTSVVFFTGLFFVMLSPLENKKNVYVKFFPIYISLLFTLSPAVLREAVMWVSGFYNYFFPALIVFGALLLLKKRTRVSYLICVFAGATTEQWGFVFIAMLFVMLFYSKPLQKSFKAYFIHFMPLIFAALGYLTIFLSPATYSRFDNHAHATVSGSLIDLPRLGEVFLGDTHSQILIFAFTALILLSVILQKRSSLLISGFLSLLLLILLPWHKSYTITFVIVILYFVMCAVIFYLAGDLFSSILFSGAIASALIMIPTNTFDARIVFPFMCFIMLLITIKLVSLLENRPVIKLFLTLPLCLLCIGVLIPSYKGFLHNYQIEKHNLNLIAEAQKTGQLDYNIDYDKNFAMRQMFNDGWFFTKFTELYNLENVNISLVSENCTDIYFKGKNLGIKCIVKDNEVYVPMREFLEKTGGSIIGDTNITMTLNGKSLRLEKGMFIYGDESYPLYAVAGDNKLHDFYTLYIKEDLIKKAFGY